MNCGMSGCLEPTVGKSKYCRQHRWEAREAWVLRVQAGEQARQENHLRYRAAWNEALAAGEKAFKEAQCKMLTPMDGVTGKIYEPIEICGFAWLKVRPATSSFAKWLVREKLGTVSRYEGGVTCWSPVGKQSQSYDRKLAACRAMAEVLALRLGELGETTRVYADGRLD